jgi:hypothetical protein
METTKDSETFLADSNNEEKTQNWSGFIENTVVNFFNEHKIEKMAVEDGYGNKAKLTRTKDCGIKIEHSSIIIL